MKILFICHANLCRSFMAQEIAKQLFPQATVFSRGLYVDPDLTIPSKVLQFLEKQQITASPHCPVQLTQEDLKEADFVFCMEPEHLEKLSDQYAPYMDKMWLLNDFAFGKETAVEDPIGLSGKAFEKQAALLQKAVTACVQRIKQEN